MDGAKSEIEKGRACETYFMNNHPQQPTSSDIFCNSGKLSLVPYTKDFGRITHF